MKIAHPLLDTEIFEFVSKLRDCKKKKKMEADVHVLLLFLLCFWPMKVLSYSNATTTDICDLLLTVLIGVEIL